MIYTVGHSTRSIEALVALLAAHRCAGGRRHVRRSRAVALPPPAYRGRTAGARDRRAAHPQGGAAPGAPAVAACASAIGRAPALSRATRPDVAVLNRARRPASESHPEGWARPGTTLKRSVLQHSALPSPRFSVGTSGPNLHGFSAPC